MWSDQKLSQLHVKIHFKQNDMDTCTFLHTIVYTQPKVKKKIKNNSINPQKAYILISLRLKIV